MDDYLRKCEIELINGAVKKRHPFRYFSLATVDGKTPRLRTVVLRKVLSDFTLLFYTDKRSLKVAHFEKNKAVSALFYNPKKLLQIRVDGRVELVTDEKESKQYWNNIPENSRKDYITKLSPGTIIRQEENIEYDEENPNFLAVKIVAHKIEYLQLQRPNHVRLLYTKHEEGWKQQVLVP